MAKEFGGFMDELNKAAGNEPAADPEKTSTRVNVAVQASNHFYLKTMSMLTGQTVADFLNDLIRKDMEAHKADFETILKIQENLKK